MQIGGMLSRSVLLVGLVFACQSAPQEASAQARCRADVPVCAVKLGVRSTLSNGCFVRVAAARKLHNGGCVSVIRGECPYQNFYTALPVCAIAPGDRLPSTYPNLCAAENDEARWLYDGACGQPVFGPGGSDVPFPLDARR
jgi:hypothetical protein